MALVIIVFHFMGKVNTIYLKHNQYHLKNMIDQIKKQNIFICYDDSEPNRNSEQLTLTGGILLKVFIKYIMLLYSFIK